MPTKKAAVAFSLADSLLNTWSINNRINTYLIEALPDAAWEAAPPGGKGRTIAAIAAHMHNVRLMWLKAAGAGSRPEQLEKTASKPDAIEALELSRAALATLLAQSLAGDGRIKGFKPDVAAFLGYLLAHDAHHRGQISMLARQLGHPISQSAMFGLWEWGTR